MSYTYTSDLHYRFSKWKWVCLARDRLVVDKQIPMQLWYITAKVLKLNLARTDVYSLQLYVRKFLSNMTQVGGTSVQPLIKLPPAIEVKYYWKWLVKDHTPSQMNTKIIRSKKIIDMVFQFKLKVVIVKMLILSGNTNLSIIFIQQNQVCHQFN